MAPGTLFYGPLADAIVIASLVVSTTYGLFYTIDNLGALGK
jgi:hypothetical protein